MTMNKYSLRSSIQIPVADINIHGMVVPAEIEFNDNVMAVVKFFHEETDGPFDQYNIDPRKKIQSIIF